LKFSISNRNRQDHLSRKYL